MIIEVGFTYFGRGIFGVRENEPQHLGFPPVERNENQKRPKVRLHATFESKLFFFQKVIAKDMEFQT